MAPVLVCGWLVSVAVVLFSATLQAQAEPREDLEGNAVTASTEDDREWKKWEHLSREVVELASRGMAKDANAMLSAYIAEQEWPLLLVHARIAQFQLRSTMEHVPQSVDSLRAALRVAEQSLPKLSELRGNIHLYLAHVYAQRHQWLESAKAYGKGVDLKAPKQLRDPLGVKFRYFRGRALLKAGKPRSAARVFSQARRLADALDPAFRYPWYAKIIVGQSRAMTELEQFKKSRACLDEALRVCRKEDPNSGYPVWANLYVAEGVLQEAQKQNGLPYYKKAFALYSKSQLVTYDGPFPDEVPVLCSEAAARAGKPQLAASIMDKWFRYWHQLGVTRRMKSDPRWLTPLKAYRTAMKRVGKGRRDVNDAIEHLSEVWIPKKATTQPSTEK